MKVILYNEGESLRESDLLEIIGLHVSQNILHTTYRHSELHGVSERGELLGMKSSIRRTSRRV